MVSINSHTNANYNTDWGIQNDTYVWDGALTHDTNYSTVNLLGTGDDDAGGDPDSTIFFEIKMPNEPIKDAKITEVSCWFTAVSCQSFVATPGALALRLFTLDSEYDFEEVTFNSRKAATPWVRGGGDFADDGGDVIDGYSVGFATYAGITVAKFHMKSKYPDWGETIQYAIQQNPSVNANWRVDYASNRNATAGYKPILKISYTFAPVEAFTSDSDKLKIVPNPADQTQPLLEWGASKEVEFKNYKVYRRAYAGAARSTLKTTITDSGSIKYIDTATTTGNAKYYYQASVSLEDDFGNIVSTLSSEVEFWRPIVTTITFDDYSANPWQEVTATIVGTYTNMPSTRTTTKFIYDWEGDASINQIHNVLAHATSDAQTHVYTNNATRSPRGRIEDNLGFQSNYKAGGATGHTQVVVAGAYPIAVIRGPTYCAKDEVYWFRADESYDVNTDGYIASTQWDWAMPAAFSSDLSAAALAVSHVFTSAGTVTVGLKVTDDDGLQSSAAASWSVEVYDDTPVVLSFDPTISRISTRTTDNGESLFAENLFMGKGGEEQRGELIWTGQDFPGHTLAGWCEGEDGRTAMHTLMGYSDSGTKLKLWVTVDKLWLIGYLSNFTYNEKGGEVNQYYWNADFICEEKSNGS
jgi:hypothetical protein